MVRIPYTKTELLIALMGIDENKLSDTKSEALKKELELISPKDNAEFNKKVAAHHGISVETLVNSPNYKELREECVKHLMAVSVNKMSETLEITEMQAWALVAAALDLL